MLSLKKSKPKLYALRNVIRLKFHLLKRSQTIPARLKSVHSHYQRHKSLRRAYRYEYERLQGKHQSADPGSEQPASVADALKAKYANCDPIHAVAITREDYRLNLVTNSLNRDYFFGGVATSVIWATLVARKHNWPLRIITRESQNRPQDYFNFLRFCNLPAPAGVEFFSDCDRGNGGFHLKLDVSEKDLFLATSWWSAAAVKRTSLRKTNYYILQEVEPFFYPYGDEHYRCQQILNDPTLRFLVNSSLLFKYFEKNGGENVVKHGCCFEPAFPAGLYGPGESTFAKKQKHLLFFYARPNNPRNLYYTGLELLDHAIKTNLLPRNEWDIVCAGAEMPDLQFSTGLVAKSAGILSWPEYSALAKRVDLCFSLMYTPHPSYPPLDMAASGAAVLTNRFMNKQSLPYSDNIICADLDMPSMLAAFAQAASLAKNPSLRKSNYLNNKLPGSWEASFQETFRFFDTTL